MTLTSSKKLIGVSLGIFAFLGMLILFLNLPFISYAQSGTLGTEKPYLYCTYYQDGVQVDGNQLEAGTYDVSFEVSGMDNISVIEITATYSDIATVESTPVALMSDAVTDMSSMGYIIGDGNMVFGFVSDNEDTSVCNSDSTTIATVAVTFSEPCDAENVITVSENPNLTFIEADYADGYDDSYAINTIDPDYNGKLYVMTCDVTPDMGRVVSGSIVVATKPDGTTANKAPYGDYTFTLYSDPERTVEVGSFTSYYDDEAKTNTFSTKLSDGTYYATLTYDYAITRSDITIKVNGADTASVAIPVIACDFDKNTSVNVLDTNAALKATSGDYNSSPYCDLDANETVNVLDVNITLVCSSASPSYPEIIIE
ncbi:MAG: hypothetical protein ACI4IQ_06755 [Eubacterium sp.]